MGVSVIAFSLPAEEDIKFRIASIVGVLHAFRPHYTNWFVKHENSAAQVLPEKALALVGKTNLKPGTNCKCKEKEENTKCPTRGSAVPQALL